MAPVQLPPPVLNNVINLPPQPHDPPRDRDVINVIKAVKSGRVAFEERKITEKDLVNLEVLGHSVIQAKAGISASLREAMEDAVATVLGRHLERITDSLDAIQADITALKEDVGLIARSAALTHNRGSAEGAVRLLLEVPFPNGQWPTRLENPLPLLDSKATVQGLSSQTAARYHQQYLPNVPVPRDLEVRKGAILTEIGCLPLVL